MKVFQVYAHFASKDNPHPYCSMATLLAETGLSERTALTARKNLISMGYLEEQGATSLGVVKYAIANPADAVERSEKSRVERASKHRSKQTTNSKARKEKKAANQGAPLKIYGGLVDSSPAVSVAEIKGDTLLKNCRGLSESVDAGSTAKIEGDTLPKNYPPNTVNNTDNIGAGLKARPQRTTLPLDIVARDEKKAAEKNTSGRDNYSSEDHSSAACPPLGAAIAWNDYSSEIDPTISDEEEALAWNDYGREQLKSAPETQSDQEEQSIEESQYQSDFLRFVAQEENLRAELPAWVKSNQDRLRAHQLSVQSLDLYDLADHFAPEVLDFFNTGGCKMKASDVSPSLWGALKQVPAFCDPLPSTPGSWEGGSWSDSEPFECDKDTKGENIAYSA